MARILIARLPLLFNKKYHIAADITVFGINSGNFPFYIDNGILCVLIRITSMRSF